MTPKFVLFEYSPLSSYSFINMGDYIQTIAVKNLLLNLGYSEENFDYFNRDSLGYYRSTEKALCVMQGWFSHHTDWLPSQDIEPVFIGTHLISAIRASFALPENQDRLLEIGQNRNFGCRDRSTLDFVQSLGLKTAYYTRCLTMTLPKRSERIVGMQPYVVDLPDSLLGSVPESILHQAKFLTQREAFAGRIKAQRSSEYLPRAEELLAEYRENASLIITSALHCALPAAAMGIPIVLISPYQDLPAENDRLAVAADTIRVYSSDELKAGAVDWQPRSIDFESEKEQMRTNFKDEIALALDRMQVFSGSTLSFRSQTEESRSTFLAEAVSVIPPSCGLVRRSRLAALLGKCRTFASLLFAGDFRGILNAALMRLSPAVQLFIGVPTIIPGSTLFLSQTCLDEDLQQRSQHLARALARLGEIVYFAEPTTFWLKEHDKNLYSVPFNPLELVRRGDFANIILFSPNDHPQALSPEIIELAQVKGSQIIYEHIDDLSLDLNLTKQKQLAHEMLLSNPDVVVICSARLLYEEAVEVRGSSKNIHLILNACDPKHWQLAKKTDKKRKVIGFFGCLEHWVDLDLLEYIATSLPEYDLCLVGPARIALDNLKQQPNCQLLGLVNYSELPQIAATFDVAILPFKVNKLTDAVSPVKLFEYACLDIPIVSTAFQEIRQYAGLVRIAEDRETFVSLLRVALTESQSIDNSRFILENSWDRRAVDFLGAMRGQS